MILNGGVIHDLDDRRNTYRIANYQRRAGRYGLNYVAPNLGLGNPRQGTLEVFRLFQREDYPVPQLTHYLIIYPGGSLIYEGNDQVELPHFPCKNAENGELGDFRVQKLVGFLEEDDQSRQVFACFASV